MEREDAVVLLLALCTLGLIFLLMQRPAPGRSHLPPGPAPLPFLGNLLQLKAEGMLNSLKELQEKYGPVFTLHLGPRQVVVLWGYEAVKEALEDRADEFSGRGKLAAFEEVLQGFGLIASNGERWWHLRQFSLAALQNFGLGKWSMEERIQEEARCLVEEFRKTKGLPFNPTFFLSCSVSNIICSIVFGRRFDYTDKRFLSLLAKINQVLVRLSSTWGQEILNPSTEFHLRNLVMTVFNLFFAGIETVTSTLCYGLLTLLKHPEVEEKMTQEISRVIGWSRMPAMEDRSKMPYTNAVLHEIQRFSNVIPMNLLRALTQDTHFRGYTIPKGTEVFPVLSSVLRDSSHFSDPESFDPGHFLDKQGHFQANDAFMPFSTGKRSCVGMGLASMELFIFLTAILQSFALKSPVPSQDIDLKPRVSGFMNIPPCYQLCAVPRCNGSKANEEQSKDCPQGGAGTAEASLTGRLSKGPNAAIEQ